MTMEMRPGRYVSQIYFVGGGGQQFDVMGFLYRDPEKHFELLFRFRYHDGDQSKGPFADGDAKSWTHVAFDRAEPKIDEAEALQLCGLIFRGLATMAGMELNVLPVRTDDSRKVLAALKSQPWVHMKDATPEPKP